MPELVELRVGGRYVPHTQYTSRKENQLWGESGLTASWEMQGRRSWVRWGGAEKRRAGTQGGAGDRKVAWNGRWRARSVVNSHSPINHCESFGAHTADRAGQEKQAPPRKLHPVVPFCAPLTRTPVCTHCAAVTDTVQVRAGAGPGAAIRAAGVCGGGGGRGRGGGAGRGVGGQRVPEAARQGVGRAGTGPKHSSLQVSK